MTINVSALLTCDVNDFIADDLTQANTAILINGCNTTLDFTASTTPAGTMVAHDQTTLTGGTDVIDCTSTVGTNGATVDATGLRPQLLIATAPTSNSGTLTIDLSYATNGLDNWGSGAEALLAGGGAYVLPTGDSGSDISGTVKNFSFAGTLNDVVNWIMIFG